jgi:hypothetical protein
MEDDLTCTVLFDVCSGESVYDVPAQSVTTELEFEACNIIRAGAGGFEVDDGGDVTFYAGNSIEFFSGFSVLNGGQLTTVIGAPMGGWPQNLDNGDFESGPTAWTQFSTHGYSLIVSSDELPSGIVPHGGNWAAWLGGDHDELAYIQQQVEVPAAAPYLTYWHWISSEDLCGYDFGEVITNSIVVDVYDLCFDNNTSGWIRRSVDLSAFAGQIVDLRISAETDSSLVSSLFIDDVSFQASGTPSL